MDNESALIHVLASCSPDNKPSFEPVMIKLNADVFVWVTCINCAVSVTTKAQQMD